MKKRLSVTSGVVTAALLLANAATVFAQPAESPFVTPADRTSAQCSRSYVDIPAHRADYSVEAKGVSCPVVASAKMSRIPVTSSSHVVMKQTKARSGYSDSAYQAAKDSQMDYYMR